MVKFQLVSTQNSLYFTVKGLISDVLLLANSLFINKMTSVLVLQHL